ncbi:MAG: hypothetical protein RMJ90_01055, partial [Candidatus Bipolaricaulota bacterium]|nr:hypothetical protein [Candidatus Bipolaricaulota bacterium]
SWCAVLPEPELSSQRLAHEIRALLRRSPALSQQREHRNPSNALLSILREIEVLLYEQTKKA